MKTVISLMILIVFSLAYAFNIGTTVSYFEALGFDEVVMEGECGYPFVDEVEVGNGTNLVLSVFCVDPKGMGQVEAMMELDNRLVIFAEMPLEIESVIDWKFDANRDEYIKEVFFTPTRVWVDGESLQISFRLGVLVSETEWAFVFVFTELVDR